MHWFVWLVISSMSLLLVVLGLTTFLTRDR